MPGNKKNEPTKNAENQLEKILKKAISDGKSKEVKKIFNKNPALMNQPMSDGIIPLVWAMINKQEMVEPLLNMGVDVDQFDQKGLTPLMYAAGRGLDKIVTQLLDNKAQVNTRSQIGGFTAMFGAAQKKCFSTMDILFQGGADINAKDDNDYSLLMATVHEGNREVVKKLIDMKADVNAKNKEGKPVFFIALQGLHKKLKENNDEHIGQYMDIFLDLMQAGATLPASEKTQTNILRFTKQMLNFCNKGETEEAKAALEVGQNTPLQEFEVFFKEQMVPMMRKARELQETKKGQDAPEPELPTQTAQGTNEDAVSQASERRANLRELLVTDLRRDAYQQRFGSKANQSGSGSVHR